MVRENNMVVRRDGCTFCCLPLLVLLALAGGAVLGLVFLLLAH